ncbi:MAG: hypothetical protein ACJAS1_007307, partial [Oleiphilaceae bacterium]
HKIQDLTPLFFIIYKEPEYMSELSHFKTAFNTTDWR